MDLNDRRLLLDEGILPITALLRGKALQRVRTQARLDLANKLDDWRYGIRNGTHAVSFFDIESLHESPVSIYVELLEVVKELMISQFGLRVWVSDFRVRVTNPYPFAYVPWHWDYLGRRGHRYKLLMYLSDVWSGGGEFCFVPGSHRIAQRELSRSSGRDISRSLGYRRYLGSCGTAILFDVRGVHGVMRNESSRPRVAAIVSLERGEQTNLAR